MLDDCTLPGHSEVFAIGDMVDQHGLPGVYEPAMQEGWYVAKVIRHRVTGHPQPGPFRYRDLGSAATIGPTNAVTEAFGIKLSGIAGKFVWSACLTAPGGGPGCRRRRRSR